MAITINAGIMACGTCLLIIANGEDTSQDDRGDAHAQRMADCYGQGVLGLVCGNVEFGFCTTPCEVCGESDAGDRHEVTELSWQ